MLPLFHKRLLRELVLATLFTCGVLRLITLLQNVSFAAGYVSLLVALWLIYFPAWLLKRRGVEADFVDLCAAAFMKSILVFCVAAVLIFVPFFGLAHLWMTWIQGSAGFHFAQVPDFFALLLTQLLLIALPEEYFFRGYFQTTMNKVFAPRWNVLGVRLGWSWVITAFVFAFAHSVIAVQWWHFAIFFPGLLFGYLRERTGNLTASVLMHAACNIFSAWIWRCYF